MANSVIPNQLVLDILIQEGYNDTAGMSSTVGTARDIPEQASSRADASVHSAGKADEIILGISFPEENWIGRATAASWYSAGPPDQGLAPTSQAIRLPYILRRATVCTDTPVGSLTYATSPLYPPVAILRGKKIAATVSLSQPTYQRHYRR